MSLRMENTVPGEVYGLALRLERDGLWLTSIQSILVGCRGRQRLAACMAVALG
jgi:hypothetical protein